VQAPHTIAALAHSAPDAQIVFNNAGTFLPQPLLAGDFDHVQETFAVNVFGPLHVARAFAPILADNGGGAIVNMLSVMSWLAGGGAYGASKAAAWSLTNSLRIELQTQGTHVLGVHAAFIDTDMASGIPLDKLSPAVVSRLIIDGLETDAQEVLTDQMTVHAVASQDRCKSSDIDSAHLRS
jgi:NAD(P)-dependent dehydrogenase (short-subunit alcohol dehydrogenase family)